MVSLPPAYFLCSPFSTQGRPSDLVKDNSDNVSISLKLFQVCPSHLEYYQKAIPWLPPAPGPAPQTPSLHCWLSPFSVTVVSVSETWQELIFPLRKFFLPIQSPSRFQFRHFFRLRECDLGLNQGFIPELRRVVGIQ